MMQLALAGNVLRDATIFANGRIHVRSNGIAVIVIERDGRTRSLLPASHGVRALSTAARRAYDVDSTCVEVAA